MGQFVDLTGKRFGRLTVVRRGEDYISPKGYRAVNWVCSCDCGETCVVRGCNLKSGASRSCGCIVEEHPNHTTHGLSKGRIYSIWCGIRDRCKNPKSGNYENYGGRGISICSDWDDDFTSFYSWSMENGYSDRLSIHRINNDGNYSPENCAWVDWSTQANNTRKTHYLTYLGKTQSISQWAEEVGMPKQRLRDRIRLGWDIAKALTTEKQRNQFG